MKRYKLIVFQVTGSINVNGKDYNINQDFSVEITDLTVDLSIIGNNPKVKVNFWK